MRFVPCTFTFDSCADFDGCKDNPWKWTGKSVWIGKDGNDVNVETLALQHYESFGFKGFDFSF
jgi:hypothetical protein